MTQVQYVNEIKSVFQGNVRIGYIARKSAVMGCVDNIPNGWIAAPEPSYTSNWSGNYKTRKEAIVALKESNQE